jgi:hypothetical protein
MLFDGENPLTGGCAAEEQRLLAEPLLPAMIRFEAGPTGASFIGK